MLVYEVKGVCGFEFLRNSLRILVMFMNEDVCKVVLIISDSADHEFSAAIFVELLKF